MTLTKDKRTGVYKVRVKTVSGKTRTITTRTTNLSDAKKVTREAKVADLENAAKTGRLTAEVIGRITADKKINLLSAIDSFTEWRKSITAKSSNTLHRDHTYLRAFAMGSKLSTQPPAVIRSEDIHAWINAPGESKLGTRKQQLAGLCAFFDFCGSKGWTVGNPARLVAIDLSKLSHQQKEKRSRHPFTDAEIERLLKATAPDGEYADIFWHAAIAIARYTGLRLGDIVSIEWDSFAIPGKVIVWTAKRDKRVELPLEPAALADAVAAVPPNKTRFLFPQERETILNPKLRSKFSTYFGRICKRLDILGKTFHDTRSSYVVHAIASGLSLEHIASSVGHSSTETTLGYLPS